MAIREVKQKFGIIGNSKGLNVAIDVAVQVAPTEVTVLIKGENGSGKDVFSRIIHQYSKRKHSPFIAINCGAIPEGTLDSELFGHEKGAFTSAYEMRKGYFEEVEGGTIFLDEIAEMPMATQARLLRLLENGEYLRVGSSKIQHADVRVIAATNKNLVDMIRQGKFREDLFFRLNTVTIDVPPLRERDEDIELLFHYFLLEFSDKYKRDSLELMEDARSLLYQYRWPGNVREIRNLAEKLTVLIKGNYVTAEDLRANLLIQDSYLPSIVNFPRERVEEGHHHSAGDLEDLYDVIEDLRQDIADMKKLLVLSLRGQGIPQTTYPPATQYPAALYPATNPNPQPQHEQSFDQYPTYSPPSKMPPMLEESLSLEKKEKEMIEKALRRFNNNRKKAADELGISERTLYRKIKNYQIDL